MELVKFVFRTSTVFLLVETRRGAMRRGGQEAPPETEVVRSETMGDTYGGHCYWCACVSATHYNLQGKFVSADI